EGGGARGGGGGGGAQRQVGQALRLVGAKRAEARRRSRERLAVGFERPGGRDAHHAEDVALVRDPRQVHAHLAVLRDQLRRRKPCDGRARELAHLFLIEAVLTGSRERIIAVGGE